MHASVVLSMYTRPVFKEQVDQVLSSQFKESK